VKNLAGQNMEKAMEIAIENHIKGIHKDIIERIESCSELYDLAHDERAPESVKIKAGRIVVEQYTLDEEYCQRLANIESDEKLPESVRQYARETMKAKAVEIAQRL
jgi:hypothetical protein